ncbi:hypothetical protein NX773_13395 [Massilia solisilvae]|uniref:Uncharacterized protein n=1 Tax=Massilia solisilvae TaxID=1811225 RepID=A0ABT2BKX2_9BURK|nr:hypothetical protein [Massilia solisilvae]MCS0609161.1 hypothetical protein [Massilia solisilvae]
MLNETIPVQLPTQVYLDLAFHLRKHGDLRNPDEILPLALRQWMAGRSARQVGAGARGYQWQDVFLPEGTELRMRYHSVWYYAQVVRDRIMYEGQTVSPREWGLLVTGGVRNAWRDIWIRRTVNDLWSRASAWRAANARFPFRPGLERRQQVRRCTD